MAWSKRDLYYQIEDVTNELRYDASHDETKRQRLVAAVKTYDLPLFTKLITQGVDPDFQCNAEGDSLIHYVLKATPSEGKRHEKHFHNVTLPMLKLLLFFGTSVDVYDRFGQTPLHLAAAGSSLEVISSLLHAGCNVNNSDYTGRTPLMVACFSDSSNVLAIVQILLDWQANIHMGDNEGKNALHYVYHQCISTKLELILKLLYSGVSCTQRMGVLGRMAICNEMLVIAGPHPPIPEHLGLYEPIKTLIIAGSLCEAKVCDPFHKIPWCLVIEMMLKLLPSMKQCFPLSTISKLRNLLVINFAHIDGCTDLLIALNEELGEVRSLKSHSRIVIRDCLKGHVYYKYDQLPLPKLLRNYLVFE